MYKIAYGEGNIVFYYDIAGNKYVASGGSLAWRTNNPGLIHSRNHFARSNGSIGSYQGFAIFAWPQQGHKALAEWLQSDTFSQSTLGEIGKYYQPESPEIFLKKLSLLSNISYDRKIQSLNNIEFDQILRSIEMICRYKTVGDECFSLLPKISGKIERNSGQEDSYLIGNDLILSKKEVIDWILTNRLDGVLVHQQDGSVYIRSRPSHCMQSIHISPAALSTSGDQIPTLIRSVGTYKPHQTVWGFINGISNTKEKALASANWISQATNGERVFSLANDKTLLGFGNVAVYGVLKIGIDTYIVKAAANFFRFLLAESQNESQKRPVVVFAHSQGVLIAEHALTLLSTCEKERLRIFTFGGASFLLPGTSHPDSHNYASAADFVCRCFGSVGRQYLALQRYYGYREGLDDRQIIERLSMKDAMEALDSTNMDDIRTYAQMRAKQYELEFVQIRNVTVLDPDDESNWKHEFASDCYQKQMHIIVKKYQTLRKEAELWSK